MSNDPNWKVIYFVWFWRGRALGDDPGVLRRPDSHCGDVTSRHCYNIGVSFPDCVSALPVFRAFRGVYARWCVCGGVCAGVFAEVALVCLRRCLLVCLRRLRCVCGGVCAGVFARVFAEVFAEVFASFGDVCGGVCGGVCWCVQCVCEAFAEAFAEAFTEAFASFRRRFAGWCEVFAGSRCGCSMMLQRVCAVVNWLECDA